MKDSIISERTPLVTVIVPVYNVEKYIRPCLDSICGQTYPHLEIILIDDGSRDSSGEICDEYAARDSRIQCLHIPNGGLVAARNRGLELMTGEYVMMVDSDDWIELDTVERVLEKALEKDADSVMWGYWREYEARSLPTYPLGQDEVYFEGEDCDRLHVRMIGLRGEELKNPASCDHLSSVAMKLYRSSIIRTQGLRFVDLSIIGTSEDTLFNIHFFAHAHRAIYVGALFYHYRKYNGTSTTSSYDETLWSKLLCLYDMIREVTVSREPAYGEALQNRIAVSLIGVGMRCVRSSLAGRTKRRVISAIIHDPTYRNAIRTLDRSPMPLPWRIFFLFAKMRCTAGVYGLLRCMKLLKGKV